MTLFEIALKQTNRRADGSNSNESLRLKRIGVDKMDVNNVDYANNGVLGDDGGDVRGCSHVVYHHHQPSEEGYKLVSKPNQYRTPTSVQHNTHHNVSTT